MSMDSTLQNKADTYGENKKSMGSSSQRTSIVTTHKSTEIKKKWVKQTFFWLQGKAHMICFGTIIIISNMYPAYVKDVDLHHVAKER